MVTLLAKWFIPLRTDYKNPETRQLYGMLCGIVGIFLNILLFLGKLLAGTLSHSIAITADAFNNLSDAGSSFITLAGFKLAASKPDSDHPYGHGRMEYLSGLFVSMLILLMAFELVKSSIEKILHPTETTFNAVILVILIASILVKLYMAFYNHSVGKKIDSAALFATATDSRSDTLSTLLVLVSSLLAHFTNIQIDGYCGLLVGLFIFYSGFQAAKDTISPLLGQAPDKEFVDKVEEIVMRHSLILGIHDMMVHDYGPGRVMVSLHAEVPANGDILEIHDLIDHIENELHEVLQCEATIHMDPLVQDDPVIIETKERVSRIILEIDDSLHFHDFRMVKGPTHTNVIFDIMVPYRFSIPDDELVTMVKQKIQEMDSSYFAVIKVDHSYT